MTCQDFETIIIEIARDRLMDADVRESGLEHVQRCASCASFLVEERALNRDLRALSARGVAEEIPASIETALLSAFRAQNVTPISSPMSVGRRRYWELAAAALVLFTIGLIAAVWSSTHKFESPSARSKQSDNAPTTFGRSKPDIAVKAERQDVTIQKSDRPNVAPNVALKKPAPVVAKRRSVSDAAQREYVTQFFPVLHGGELIPLESGQIVRVRMPRSNLIPLGIPFNQERTSETIRADVLVSNDGLARAIRLVY